MTKEEFLKTYLSDPLFQDKGYLKPEQVAKVKFSEESNIKLIEILKIAIEDVLNDFPATTISRKINNTLNR